MALVIAIMKTKRYIQSISETKCLEEKHLDLFLIEGENKKHFVLIKYFNTFIYDDTLHRRVQYF